MPVSTSPDNQSVDYRYFVCDLLTNELLAEIPLRGVSYSRSLTEAGSLTGDIAVTEDTYNLSLYENTLPARTAIYAVRNGVCVWGGIIWGRTYSLIDKVLSITATEFTSYLAHRVVWKTWNSAYEATAEVSGDIVTVTLSGGQYNFTVGEAVYLSWPTDYAKYNGYFDVLTVSLTDDDRSVFTAPAEYVNDLGLKKKIPKLSISSDDPMTVQTRQDTYQFAQDLLRELNTDLFDFDFANDLIRPGIEMFNEIESVSRSANIATVVTTKKHELVPGQKVVISDVEVDANFDKEEAIVLSVISEKSFTYSNPGSDVATTTLSDFPEIITSFKRSGNIATFETSNSNPYESGDIVYIENVSETFDGFFTVYEDTENPSSSTEFKVVMYGANIAKSYTDNTTKTITGAAGNGATVTFQCADHDFIAGENVTVTDVVPSSFNGQYIVTSTTTNSFTVSSSNTATYSSGGKVGSTFTPTSKRRGAVRYGTYGEFSTLGDIGLDLSYNDEFSSNREANPVIRGFELKTVAEIFEEYSTKPKGFEYRVDCVYDQATNSFKKYFKFLPLIPKSLTDWLSEQETGYSGAIPASAYGATELIFEYPGNILEAQFEESAEEAATRFFVQGKDDSLSSEASQPYSAAANHKLLREGWPILDQVDDLNSADETVLYKQAARLLEESVPPISAFSISVNGSAHPMVGTYNPGDWCSVKLNDDFVSLRADSYLEQDYGSDNGVLVRKIVAFDVSVPDSPGYPEEVKLELITEPSIPISGITIVDGKALI